MNESGERIGYRVAKIDPKQKRTPLLLPCVRQISGGSLGFVANTSCCRMLLRRKTRKKLLWAENRRNFASSIRQTDIWTIRQLDI